MLRYGFNKDFNDLLNGFFGNLLDLPKRRILLPKINRKQKSEKTKKKQ